MLQDLQDAVHCYSLTNVYDHSMSSTLENTDISRTPATTMGSLAIRGEAI